LLNSLTSFWINSAPLQELIAWALTYRDGMNWETASLIDIFGFSITGVPVIGSLSTTNCWAISFFG
jgi:hypothetical protein